MGLTDPITKLIEVVANGVGVLYEPTRIIRAGKAEGQRLIERKKAELNNLELDEDFRERMANRMVHREIQKQHNIDAISRIAIEEVSKNDEITDEKVDEDWVNRFFRYAEDVSNEDLQKIWGKILAGEVRRPNSYSLRTLEFIKNLSSKEAELIFKCFTLVIGTKSRADFIFNSAQVKNKNYFLTHEEGLLLMELGILNVNSMQLGFTKLGDKKLTHFRIKEYTYMAQVQPNVSPSIPVVTLTKLAKELYILSDNIELNGDYFKEFLNAFKSYNALMMRAEMGEEFITGEKYNMEYIEY